MLLSAVLGSTICWYDFVIFGIATAMVFSKLFFPDLPFIVPMLVFAVGFFTRPLGSIIFGHLGDKFGRKKTLVTTLMLTASCTVAIGLLPTYAAIGVAAPVLLVLLRILQTIALGGEWAAASTMMAEYNVESPRKGFWGGLLGSGLMIASILASAMFALVTGFGKEEFLDWAWRIPFLSSAILLLVGMYVRLKVLETPAFVDLSEQNKVQKVPVKTVLRDHWGKLALAVGTHTLGGAWYHGIIFFGIGFMVNNLQLPRGELMGIWAQFSYLALAAVVVYGWLGDKIGLIRLYQIGALMSLIFAWPIMTWLSQGNLTLPLLVGIVGISMITWAPATPVLTEIFPADVRQTGSGLAMNLSSVLSGGVGPLVATALLGINNDIRDAVWWYLALTVISLGCSFYLAKLAKAKEEKLEVAPA